jgi:hypothetical protein
MGRLAPEVLTPEERERGCRRIWELTPARQAEVRRGVLQEQRPVSAALAFWAVQA